MPAPSTHALSRPPQGAEPPRFRSRLAWADAERPGPQGSVIPRRSVKPARCRQRPDSVAPAIPSTVPYDTVQPEAANSRPRGPQIFPWFRSAPRQPQVRLMCLQHGELAPALLGRPPRRRRVRHDGVAASNAARPPEASPESPGRAPFGDHHLRREPRPGRKDVWAPPSGIEFPRRVSTSDGVRVLIPEIETISCSSHTRIVATSGVATVSDTR